MMANTVIQAVLVKEKRVDTRRALLPSVPLPLQRTFSRTQLSKQYAVRTPNINGNGRR